jgi:hypothetical protein
VVARPQRTVTRRHRDLVRAVMDSAFGTAAQSLSAVTGGWSGASRRTPVVILDKGKPAMGNPYAKLRPAEI